MAELPKHCRQCASSFPIDDRDQAFYEKMKVPGPTLCPDCRLQRRLAHRNEHCLYERKCDATEKSIISVYSSDKPCVVYDLQEWWSDRWDPLQYGQSFDFNRPFFEQFAELQRKVPRMAVLQSKTENSLYTNCVSNLKNCYLLFSSDYNHDCAYGVWVENCRDCLDNLIIDHCERTYESVFSDHLYNCSFVIFSTQCHDSSFLFDCHDCAQCFMCSNLRHKKYCIANVQCTKEEYCEKLRRFPMSSWNNLEQCRKQFDVMIRNAIHLFLWRKGRVIDSTGDVLSDVEHCRTCFDLVKGKDCAFCLGYDIKDAMDCTYVSGEVGYENCECFPMPFRSAFNVNSYTGSDLFYCDLCMNNCSHCFGCIGLRHQQYCILNRQYTKEEYERLALQIIEHMKQGGEWGEFFPMTLSLFSYNESEAQDYYPCTRDEVEKMGCSWKEADAREQLPATCSLPDSSEGVHDSLTKEMFACARCGKNYRIISREIAFYQHMHLTLPLHCFQCRHLRRMAYKNPRKLHKRPCSNCDKEVESTFSRDRSEKVFCERCYLEAVY